MRDASWTGSPDEHLATGWDRDVPAGDTLLRAYVDGFVAMADATARAAGGRVLREPSFVAADSLLPSAYSNAAALLGPLDADAAPSVVERLRAFYGEASGGPWLLLGPTPTPDLRGLGLSLVGHPPFMVRAPGGSHPPGPAELELVEVTDEGGLREFERTVIEAYPFPELADAGVGSLLLPELLDDDSFRFWLARVDGRTVATGAAHRAPAATHVEWISTRPDVRGRGYGAAITWPPTLAWPDRPATLVASDAGRPVYERMGFLAVTRVALWIGSR